MCGDNRRYTTESIRELQDISRQCQSDEHILAGVKALFASPMWQDIKSQSMYDGLHDIIILSDIVAAAWGLQMVGRLPRRPVVFCADEFGQGGRNASKE